jgi:DNA-directed RNA polymerase subunit M/transcription elongation factor TFIIS
MKIQYVSKYIALSEEGLVSKMECPIDQGLLLSNLDKEDNIFLYCLSCDYKKNIGTKLYDDIVRMVNHNEKM